MLLFFVGANPIAGDSGEVIKGLVAAVAGGTLWQAKLPAPIPTLIIGAVYWVAAEGASRVNLDELIVRTSAVQKTIIISCWCRVVIADSTTWLYFVNSLTSGAHWIF